MATPPAAQPSGHLPGRQAKSVQRCLDCGTGPWEALNALNFLLSKSEIHVVKAITIEAHETLELLGSRF